MSISILKLHEYADAANNIIGGGLTARRFEKIHPLDASSMLLALKSKIDDALQCNASMKCDGVEYMMDMLKRDVLTKSHMFAKLGAEAVTVKCVKDSFDFPGNMCNIRDLEASLDRWVVEQLKVVYTSLCKKNYLFSEYMVKFATVRRSDMNHACIELRSPLSDVICTFDLWYGDMWFASMNVAQIVATYEEFLKKHDVVTYTYQDKFSEV